MWKPRVTRLISPAPPSNVLHISKPRRGRKRRPDNRPASALRGYDRAWRHARREIIRREPLCRICRARGIVKAAVDVDHIIPIAKQPELRLTSSNLRPLCRPCHAARRRKPDNAA